MTWLIATSLFLPATALAEKFFPLSPGNSWSYRDLAGVQEVLTIEGIIEVQGVPMVEASYTGRNPFLYLASVDGIGRLEPAPGIDRENLRGHLSFILSWPLEPGRSWDSPWSDPPLTFTVLQRGAVDVAAGTFPDAVKVGYRPATDPIYLGYMWFVPGVGMVVHEENGSRVELVSYDLSDLLPPPSTGRSMADLAGLFSLNRNAPLDGDTERDGALSPAKLAPVVGTGVLLMMVLALAAYLRSVRIDVELEDDTRVQEGEAVLASAMVREGLYSEAAQILQRLTARHPQWPDIAALLGSAYRESGQLDEACLEFKRALTLNPDMPTARLDLARTYLDLGDPVRAAVEVDIVLGDHGEFADAVYLKGETLTAMGDEDGAAEAFRKALSINPSFAKAQAALERTLAASVEDQDPNRSGRI